MTINRYTVGAWALFALFVGLIAFMDHRQNVRDQKAAPAHWEDQWLFRAAYERCGDFIPDESSTLGDLLAHSDCIPDVRAALQEACSAERERWLSGVAEDHGIEYEDCIALHVDIDLPPYDAVARYPGVDLAKPIGSP